MGREVKITSGKLGPTRSEFEKVLNEPTSKNAYGLYTIPAETT